MKQQKIVVFGSYIADLITHCNRLPTIGETIKASSFNSGPGGKGSNQAVAAQRAGADVLLITKIGNDYFGKAALDFYSSENMPLEGIIVDNNHATGCALIMVGDDTAQNMITVYLGACDHFTSKDIEFAKTLINGADIILVQLETNLNATTDILQYAKRCDCLTVLNPAPAQQFDENFYELFDIVIPNETEASILTNSMVENDLNSLRFAANNFIRKGVNKIIITLGSNGVYGFDGASDFIYPANAPYRVVDTTGAGDAFCGGFVAGLSKNYSFYDSVRYGTTVAGLSVTKYGAAPSMPYAEEINKYYKK